MEFDHNWNRDTDPVPKLERKPCAECIFQTERTDGLYCMRYKHWLREGNLQITLTGFNDRLCDWKPKIKNERKGV